MFLPDSEVRPCIDRVSAAFPRFDDWQYVNEDDLDYTGFTLWGEFVLDSKKPRSRHYYITIHTCKTMWVGHLSIGKHCYFWSSADFGDAYLVDTENCATLDEAIASLKNRIANLFAAFSGSAG